MKTALLVIALIAVGVFVGAIVVLYAHFRDRDKHY